MSEDIEELKNEATQLNIKFHPNITAVKLQARIDEKYEELSKEDPATPVLVKPEKDVVAKGSADDKLPLVARMKRLANELFVVTIADNDQRVNSTSNSCVANCGNAHFDLGTRILPTDQRVEVRRGHLEALRDVRIPHHIPSTVDKTISETVYRPRYSFQFHGKSPSGW